MWSLDTLSNGEENVSTNKISLFSLALFSRSWPTSTSHPSFDVSRNAGSLDQHLTKKGERELGNYLMASTWPNQKYNGSHCAIGVSKMKTQPNGYHWTNVNKRYQNYLAINYGVASDIAAAAATASNSLAFQPTAMDCGYIMGKWADWLNWYI